MAREWYYLDPRNPDLGGYAIEHGAEGHRWLWSEAGMNGDVDFGAWVSTRAEALRDAALDWEYSGSGAENRFAGRLRALATRSDSAVGGNRSEGSL